MLNAMQRAVRYNERTALIILLFSNESVDADGSVPAHARCMGQVASVSLSSLPRRSLLPIPSISPPPPRFGEQKKELFRHNERVSPGAFVESLSRSQYITCAQKSRPGEKRLPPVTV